MDKASNSESLLIKLLTDQTMYIYLELALIVIIVHTNN